MPWLLCMTLVLGIVMGGAYLAGRKAKPEPTAQGKPAMEPLVIPTVEASSKDPVRAVPVTQPKAVQPIASTVPPKAQTPPTAPAAAATPTAAPAGLAPGVLSDQDAKGLLFLQVAAVDCQSGPRFRAEDRRKKGSKSGLPQDQTPRCSASWLARWPLLKSRRSRRVCRPPATLPSRGNTEFRVSPLCRIRAVVSRAATGAGSCLPDL